MSAPMYVPDSDVPIPRLLSREDVASMMRVTPDAVRKLESRGSIPASFRIGRRAFWLTQDFEAWLEQRASAAREGVVYEGN